MPHLNLRGSLHAYDQYDPTDGDPDLTLVFIHGWLLSRSYWQPLIAQLRSHWGCLSYDLRGFGESTANPDQGHSPVDYAEDLIDLLTALNLQRVWLVGHSLGGTIALWAARLCPERIAGVIGVNAGGGIYIEQEFERFRGFGQQLIRWRPQWLRQIPGAELPFCWDSVHRPLPRQWARRRLRDFLGADAAAATGSLLDSTTAEQVNCLPSLVARLTQPAYFLAGDRDTIMPPAYVQHLASFHPSFGLEGHNLRQLEDCGHLAMLEQTNAVAEAIHTWIYQAIAAEQSDPALDPSLQSGL
ncbi:alpha/beta fold hydrolase [Synechococcus elongatus]|uniref:Alpha/beta hydrolase n=1 Tax=Synechococcus elongatus PCC 11802 TaxID=2283154 RepID=A0AAT9K5H2_SYNEL|nr:alpha/beta hydrolase [Synechococcus elongatus]QFZ93110.1 alpha/beta hydrolase [Synechococcus elongatus PCC 11802]